MILCRDLRSIAVALLILVASNPASALPHAREDAQSAPISSQPSPRPSPDTRRAQRADLTRAWFVGSWETRNIEFGREVTIIWTLWEDGRLAYDFVVDGVPSRGSTGTWEYRDGIMHEDWLRPDGSTGAGHGRVEKIDENTLRLTISDNGRTEYQGLSRVYKRLAPPQVVDTHRTQPHKQ